MVRIFSLISVEFRACFGVLSPIARRSLLADLFLTIQVEGF